MRISTVTMYEQSLSALNRQQGEFTRVGQQIATGRRVVNPSDDPQAASRAVQVAQSLAVTGQYADARVSARNALSQEESVLDSVGDAIASAKTQMIRAASDTLSDADRDSVASDLRGIYETLIGQANATDGNGRHLFGGYQDASEPFVRAADGSVSYVGDTNVRQQRIDASRTLPVTDNGKTIFQSVHSSAGYVAEAADGNAGNVTFNGPRIIDESDPAFGNAFQIDFQVAAGATTYTVNGGAPQPYEDGAPITVGGLSITLKGTPADNDSVTMDRASNMNTDLFKTFEKALAVLEQPAGTDAQKAARSNTINTVMRELDNSLDNVLTVRASVGARLNELDVVDSVGANRKLNYTENLSNLMGDLSNPATFAEVVSEYSLRQVSLEAARKAFVDIKGTSLFDRL
ncbi:flagellar hook-associated protein FlgL [Alloalcanivorax gelatiniphagus]|uniref:Flagellar hook-associated protein 3 n=1 Tax=Alloalcanivorax gelatiniphagus TaxID=1194167 RepID=A0ABY2XFS9_9GAMM|nr:flagellar hook-associated protein FlgL [Alloalcanivorax gelatiniphagus]TMW10455.1 flagellar hook-associated protein 3 [Alloalcanivorax gelatiniphagus]|tara:strand:- start:3330 stop:4541 length:1212 start_codon:yes stop_codon:yes gene_type:complete